MRPGLAQYAAFRVVPAAWQCWPRFQLGPLSAARIIFGRHLLSLIMKQLPLSSTRRRALGSMGREAMMEWFYRKTSIAGVQISNWILAIVAVVVLWIIYSAFIQ